MYTVESWLHEWMNLYVWPTGLAKSTKACYNRAVASIPGWLGCVPLKELSPLLIRRWLLSVAEKHPRAAQLDRQVIRKALSVAAKCGLCRAGLVDDDVCPQIVHKAAKAAILTTEQLRAYMAAAAETDVAPLLMLMCCGLRRGEAMGARWENINLEEGTLLVAGQRASAAQQAPAPLKTDAARRLIALPDQLLRVLNCWPRNLSGWVCSCGSHKLYAVHRRLLRQLSLPAVTLHGLRHSFATAAAADGVPIKVLQVSLGHAKYQLTADLYADHLPSLCAVSRSIFAA